MLLDEPLAAIGLADRGTVAAAIGRALEGRSAIIVTHDRQTAAALGDRVAVLIDGAIRQIGLPSEVFALPDDDAVAAALGIANVMTGEVMETDGALVALKVGPLVVWGIGDPQASGRALFGAETVTLYAGDRPDSGSARNTWPGTVAEIRPEGYLVEVLVDCGPTVVALVTPGAVAGLNLRAGDAATVAVKATAVRIL
jgi:molybdopterin-binding protein